MALKEQQQEGGQVLVRGDVLAPTLLREACYSKAEESSIVSRKVEFELGVVGEASVPIEGGQIQHCSHARIVLLQGC
jgi:hypothetical protein